MRIFGVDIRVAMLTLVALVGADWAQAQPAENSRLVEARFEPQEVLIGDHFELRMAVEVPEGTDVGFPTITEEFTEGRIELLEELPADTVATTEGRYELRKRYRLTCFEPAEYRVDSVGVLCFDGVALDTLFASAPLSVKVDIMPVDTAQKTIYDIKQPLEAPLVVEEFAGYMGYGLVVLAALVSVVYLLWGRRRRSGKSVAEELPKEAPHVVAIRALEQLVNQKLWQNGKHKAYYTRLTDILRDYLFGRYGVGAMEMTSAEILAALKELPLTERQRADLGEILSESDLVKFAKHTPTAEMNEGAYYKIYYFVEETKVQPEPKEQQGGVPEQLVEVTAHTAEEKAE